MVLFKAGHLPSTTVIGFGTSGSTCCGLVRTATQANVLTSLPLDAGGWTDGRSRNCWPGRGATSNPCCGQNDNTQRSTLAECKAYCLSVANCNCVTYSPRTKKCYLRKDCEFNQCASGDSNWISSTFAGSPACGHGRACHLFFDLPA